MQPSNLDAKAGEDPCDNLYPSTSVNYISALRMVVRIFNSTTEELRQQIEAYPETILDSIEVRRTIYYKLKKDGCQDQFWQAAKSISHANRILTLEAFNDRKSRIPQVEQRSPMFSPKGAPSREAKQNNQNRLLSTMHRTLSIQDIIDPISPEDEDKFIDQLSTVKQRIEDYCIENKFNLRLGRQYLASKLTGSKSFDYRTFTSSENFKQAEIENPLQAFRQAVAQLMLSDLKEDSATQWSIIKNLRFPSVSSAWSKYTKFLTRFPNHASRNSMSAQLADLRELLPSVTSFSQIEPLLHTAECRQRFTDLYNFRRFLSSTEKTLRKSVGYSIAVNNTSTTGNCSNWSKYGSCRFGNSCKYKHSDPQENLTKFVQQKASDKPLTPCFAYWKDQSCNVPSHNHSTHDELARSRSEYTSCPLCSRQKQRSSHIYCPTCFQQHLKFHKDNRSHKGKLGKPKDHMAIKVEHLSTQLQTLLTKLNDTATTNDLLDAPKQISSMSVLKTNLSSPPSLIPTCSGDMRLFASFYSETVSILADTGGQVSVIGDKARRTLSRLTQFESSKINIPITGLVKVPLMAKELLHCNLMIDLINGDTLPFAISFLYIPIGFNDMVIGMPDLIANSMHFILDKDNPRLTTRNGFRVKTQSCSSHTYGKIQIDSFSPSDSLQRGNLSIFKVSTHPNHDSTFVTDPEDLLCSTLSPSVTQQKFKQQLHRTPLPKSLSPIGDIHGPSSKLFNNTAMLAKINQLAKDTRMGKTFLTTEQFFQVRFILSRFQKQFVTRLPEVGKMRNSTYSLRGQLLTDKNLAVRPYKLTEPKASWMEEALTKDVDAGLRFRPGPDDCISCVPCFPLFQADKMRIVGNYTPLNDITRLDLWPCPTVFNSVKKFGSHLYKSVFDAKSGFHQCAVDDFTSRRTVWITQFSLYAAKCMMLGMKNAMQHFCRVMQSVFRDIPNAFPHVDDLFQSADTYEEWFRAFTDTLLKCESETIYLKIAKLQIAPKELHALGQLFTGRTLRPDPNRFKSIKEIRTPRSTKEAQSVLSLFTFWMKYIPHLQTHNSPIRDVIKEAQGQKIAWTQDAEQALRSLQKFVLTKAALSFPDYSKISEAQPFALFSDSSSVAMGYVLCQNKALLKCGSKTFPRSEFHVHITRKEFRSLIFGLQDSEDITAYLPIAAGIDAKNIEFFVRNAKAKLSPVWTRFAVYLVNTLALVSNSVLAT